MRAASAQRHEAMSGHPVPANHPLTISKAEGASRQVEEAIKALERGDFDIAITLAGAAEGMLERSGHQHVVIHDEVAAGRSVRREERIGSVPKRRAGLVETPERRRHEDV